ncbi:MAG: B-box zinc finger protein [Candidatus Nanoarchaeia archaeon]|nr:B-box zinc finger protein [Candidatus Nanoarchaeia archaeon]
MEIQKICQVCSKKPAEFSCINCGRVVCRNCYILSKKTCKGCISLFI